MKRLSVKDRANLAVGGESPTPTTPPFDPVVGSPKTGPGSMMAFMSQKSDVHAQNIKLEARLADSSGDNEKLKREIVALKSDRRYLESIARKDFGLVRSNEVIYQFPQEKKEQPIK